MGDADQFIPVTKSEGKKKEKKQLKSHLETSLHKPKRKHAVGRSAAMVADSRLEM